MSVSVPSSLECRTPGVAPIGGTARRIAGATAPAAANYDTLGVRHEVSTPVAVVEDGPADNTAATAFCTPRHWADGPRRADVLVAGATYNREYWDSSFDPETYSYVDDTSAAGRRASDVQFRLPPHRCQRSPG
ncbi:hypothetical protein [Nocardia grenadensis]|uniref:hypothetical protein n=1 Tax=Nocardia grenadensis TaxID=931537 RepID=UPI003D7239BF